MGSLLIKFELGLGSGLFPLKYIMFARRSLRDSPACPRPLCSPSLSSHTESVRQVEAGSGGLGSAHPHDSSRSFRSEPGLGFCSLPSSALDMLGHEVHEYTNLSNPKGVQFFRVHQFVELPAPIPTPLLFSVKLDRFSSMMFWVFVQIGSWGRGRTKSAMRTSPSTAWWQRLDRIVLQPQPQYYCLLYTYMLDLGFSG
jgi:hypothetical protein